MKMYNKVVTAAEAVSHIKDNSFVAISGVNVAGTPMELIDAVADRYKKEGHPKSIDFTNSGNNGYIKPLAVEGLAGVYYAGFPSMDYKDEGGGFTDNNVIPVFHFTQGIGTQFYRAQASRVPYLTRIGMGTYLDPRVDGACANEKAKELQKEKQIVKLMTIDGVDYLHINLPPVTVALIRGTSADTDGNLINDDEVIKNELLPMAMAAHNNGGIVIAQVKNILEPGQIDAASVKVPGMLVDYVVQCSDTDKWQPQNLKQWFANDRRLYHPGLTGHYNCAIESIPIETWAPTGLRMSIARRAIMELKPDCVANVGLGIPTGIPYIAYKEGVHDMYYQTIELGAIGGYTGSDFYFSAAFNARAYLDHNEMFGFIDGGGLDISFLGVGDMDERGCVNVTRIKGVTNGSGGFVNISTNAKKIVFLTSHTAGGDAEVVNGKLKITKPGKPLKFVKDVEQISFNSAESMKRGQEIMCMTERAVFRIENEKLTLIEYADGLDIENDIIAAMGFRPEISPDLKPMPAYVFSDEPIGLKAMWEK